MARHDLLQENYIKSTPRSILNGVVRQDREMKHIELIEKAAMSISDGDLVDAMIHGCVDHCFIRCLIKLLAQ